MISRFETHFEKVALYVTLERSIVARALVSLIRREPFLHFFLPFHLMHKIVDHGLSEFDFFFLFTILFFTRTYVTSGRRAVDNDSIEELDLTSQ